jgi:hypothetical protein
MFDVRNAISTVLDRYTLADIVEITLRKYRRDKVTPPFLHRSMSQKKESLRSKRRAVTRNQFSRSKNETNNHPPKMR